MQKSFLTLLLNIIIFLFALSANVYADEIIGPWASTENLPSVRASHGSFFKQNKVYAIGGANTNVVPLTSSSTIQVGGTLSGWTSTSFPPSLFYHSMILKNNLVYSLGGATYPPTSHHNFVYLGTIDASGQITSWTSLNPLPKNLSLGATVVVGNRIYYAGGFNESETNQKVYVAPINTDGTIGAWSEAGDLPIPLFGFGMLEHNNNLIVIGGFSSGSNQAKTYTVPINANGTIGSWQETASLPEKSYRAQVVKVGSKLLVIGGNNETNCLNKVHYADINADATIGSWSLSQNNLPQPVCAGSATVSENYIYVIGGFNGNYLSSVYFTKIEGTDSSLAVLLLKQTAEPWQSLEYDTANIWNPSNPSINAWGCALTSAAMIFQFHGIKKLPDGTTLDPGTLNRWLNSQRDGYIRNGLLNWLALSRLSRLAKNINGLPFDALEYSRMHGENKPQLTSDINNSIPDILEEPGHFIVGKGINGATFDINDPFYNRATLNDGYSNTFLSLGRYIPSSTDLSYIMIVVNANVNISLLDSSGNPVGEQFIQQPLTNDADTNQTSGSSLKIVYFQKPPSGNYQAVISAPNNQQYQLNAYLYDKNGSVDIIEREGVVGSADTDIYQLSFDGQNSQNSSFEEVITFSSLLADLNSSFSLGLINNNGVFQSLTIKANVSQLFSFINKTVAKNVLNALLNELNAQRGKQIKEGAYQILFKDASYLKNHL